MGSTNSCFTDTLNQLNNQSETAEGSKLVGQIEDNGFQCKMLRETRINYDKVLLVAIILICYYLLLSCIFKKYPQLVNPLLPVLD